MMPPHGLREPQGPYRQAMPPRRENRHVVVLVLAGCGLCISVFGCVACGPFTLLSLALSIPAIVIAHQDLKAIDAGTLDPTSRDSIKVGLVLAWVSIGLSALGLIIGVILMVLYGSVFLMALFA